MDAVPLYAVLNILAMTGLENYLIEQGYTRYHYDHKTMSLVKSEGYLLSTMGNLDYRYVLDDDFDNQIIFGLNEKGKPATLIYPRPNIRVQKGSQFIGNEEDNAMNTVLMNFSHEDILDAIKDADIILSVHILA